MKLSPLPVNIGIVVMLNKEGNYSCKVQLPSS